MLTSADIIAISSVAVALAAMVITVWQAALMRAHNRLSVKPHLQMTSYLGSAPLRISLANVGVGPAYIRHVQVFADGQQIEGEGFPLLVSALRHLRLQSVEEITVTGGLPRAGDVFAVGEREDILNVPEQPVAVDVLNAALHRLTFKVTYASAYAEEAMLVYSPGKLYGQRAGA